MSARLHEIGGSDPASHTGDSRHPGPEAAVDLSVVIPIFDERDNLTLLHQRLTEVLGGLDRSYELIFVDDGSTDGSVRICRELAAAGAKLFYEFDGHPNAEGYRLTAKGIVAHLERATPRSTASPSAPERRASSKCATGPPAPASSDAPRR